MKKITIGVSEELRQLMMEEDVTEEWISSRSDQAADDGGRCHKGMG